ncbi:MAG: cell division protein FtsA [Synergistaceae bacterium]|nr:cell division protein FtsA [Synergistaceae bacterium]
MPGKSDNLLVGLSIGTTKITMIVAERDRRYPDSVHVIGFGKAPSRGISKGIIVSLQDARQSVQRAFADAQSMTGISPGRLRNVIVAFNGMDIKNESTHGMVTLGGRESKSVEESDLNRVIERAMANSVLATASRNSMYSLHMIPTNYELDGRPINEPLNMNGNQLDIWIQTVAVPMTYAQDVVNCVQSAGLEVKGLLLKPIASALGAAYDDEMRAGCISVCIGGGTTGIVLFRNGRAFRVMSIPIGGDHIRSDLASVLHISLSEAERLKQRIFIDSEEDLRRNGIDIDLAYQAIFARLEELFNDQIRRALAECTPQHFPSGIILSGGVSDTPGIEMMLENILQIPVRKVYEPVYTFPQPLANAAYVSSAGILKYYVTVERDPYVFMDSGQELPGLHYKPDPKSKDDNKGKKHIPSKKEKVEDDYPDEGGYDEEPEGYDGYDEGESDDVNEEPDPYGEGRTKRENFTEIARTIAEKIKRLF